METIREVAVAMAEEISMEVDVVEALKVADLQTMDHTALHTANHKEMGGVEGVGMEATELMAERVGVVATAAAAAAEEMAEATVDTANQRATMGV